MWNLSYGRIAAEDLAAAHARAARAALIAQLPRTTRDRHPIRAAIGELLIRAGARLVMSATPSTPSTVR
jgi:hypothetical protein